MSEHEKGKSQKQKKGKPKPLEINWRAWYLGGVLFFISIPLGLYLWNPFTGVQQARKRVDALEGRADLEVVAPGPLQAIFGNDVGLWSKIAGGTQIMRLHLDQSKVTDEDLRMLRSMPFLKSLHLSETQITDAGLSNLPYVGELQELNLSKVSKLSDQGLTVLSDLEKLEALDLEGTPVSDGILETLKTLPSLKSVNLARTNITPEGFEKIRSALAGVEVRPKPGDPLLPPPQAPMK